MAADSRRRCRTRAEQQGPLEEAAGTAAALDEQRLLGLQGDAGVLGQGLVRLARRQERLEVALSSALAQGQEALQRRQESLEAALTSALAQGQEELRRREERLEAAVGSVLADEARTSLGG